MKTGPSEAAFLARLVSWLNSRLDNVVIVIGDAPVCSGKSLVYKRYYKTPLPSIPACFSGCVAGAGSGHIVSAVASA
jgi:hypothetical protein